MSEMQSAADFRLFVFWKAQLKRQPGIILPSVSAFSMQSIEVRESCSSEYSIYNFIIHSASSMPKQYGWCHAVCQAALPLEILINAFGEWVNSFCPVVASVDCLVLLSLTTSYI